MRLRFTRSALSALACAPLILVSPAAWAGPDPVQVLIRLHAQDQAVERVGYRLITANADLCPDGADAGFSVHTLEQYGPDYRAAAARLFGLGDPPGVLAVAPGSAAAAAGLREGDALLEIDGRALPLTVPAGRRADFARTAAVQARIQAALKTSELRLTVLRAGAQVELLLHPAAACASIFQVAPDSRLTGGADGDYVQVSSELASLAVSDDELAGLLGHELAHNVLGHPARLDALHVARGLLSFLGRNARLIRASEREADRLGVYLLARAGYRPEQAIGFWIHARDAARGGIGDPTHPSWAERLALVRAEADRIEAAGASARQLSLPPDLAAELPRP